MQLAIFDLDFLEFFNIFLTLFDLFLIIINFDPLQEYPGLELAAVIAIKGRVEHRKAVSKLTKCFVANCRIKQYFTIVLLRSEYRFIIMEGFLVLLQLIVNLCPVKV